MAFLCPHCSEKLFGAVNRCWACGRAIQVHDRVEIVEAATADAVPPGSESPQSVSPQSESPGANAEEPVLAAADSQPPVAAHPPVAAEYPQVFQPRPPWAEANTDNLPAQRRAAPTPPSPQEKRRRLERQKAAVGGAVAAIVVGLASLGAAWFSVTAVLGAGVGFVLGIWGLQSKWQWVAALGMLLCLLAIGLSLAMFSLRAYDAVHGHYPWETPVVTAEEAAADELE